MKDDSYERIDKMWETKAMEEKELLKAKISDLLVENHPAELERLTGVEDTICKKIVHELYMERFNDPNCWETERVGDVWVIFGKACDEWIDENGDYRGFDTKEEAKQYIQETIR